MINLKLYEIKNILEPLRKLSKYEFSIKTSWKILNIIEEVEKLNNKIENFRINFIEKNGEEIVEFLNIDLNKIERVLKKEFEKNIPNNIENVKYKIEIIDSFKLEKFIKEFEEFLNIEEKLNINKITLDELENIKISANDIFMLKGIIE